MNDLPGTFVANAAPTATFSAPATVTPGQSAVFRFDNAADPSVADAVAGFRYGYDFNNDGDFVDAGEAENVADASRAFAFTAGTHTVRGRIVDKDGGFTDYTATVVAAAPAVVGRYVFYNNSSFDGADRGPGPLDDGAVAIDKHPLLEHPPTAPPPPPFAAVTSYAKGLNGVMVDVRGLADPDALTADDFGFRTGTAADRAAWADGPSPSVVHVRRGAGTGGADRVTLVWHDYNPLADPGNMAVANGWLEVTVRATDRTGLAAPDVFSFGNLVGETGDNAAALRVSALDMSAVKRALNGPAPVSAVADFNRDGRINALDLAVVKRALNQTLAMPTTPPQPAPAAPPPLASSETEVLRRVNEDLLA